MTAAINSTGAGKRGYPTRSEERFSRNAETDLVCRLLLEKKKKIKNKKINKYVHIIYTTKKTIKKSYKLFPYTTLFRSLTGRSTPLIMFSVNSAPSMMRQAV